VFARIEPGETRRYDYELPGDHPSGLFWYHPHQHGDVARQVGAGLVGAIIVEDALDDVDGIAATSERLWVLNDPSSADRTLSGMDQMHGRAGPAVLVNGVSGPNVEATGGRTERWRIVNASASRPMPFAIDGLTMTLIGTDGGRLAEPLDVGGIVLVPGERAEVLITPTNPDMTYTVMGDRPLATLAVQGSASLRVPEVPALQRDSAAFDIGQVTTRRTLRLGAGMSGGMMSGSSMMEFTIDDKTFDPDRVDISTTLGEVEDQLLLAVAQVVRGRQGLRLRDPPVQLGDLFREGVDLREQADDAAVRVALERAQLAVPAMHRVDQRLRGLDHDAALDRLPWRIGRREAVERREEVRELRREPARLGVVRDRLELAVDRRLRLELGEARGFADQPQRGEAIDDPRDRQLLDAGADRPGRVRLRRAGLQHGPLTRVAGRLRVRDVVPRHGHAALDDLQPAGRRAECVEESRHAAS